jgi:hypothetical protein
MAARAPNAALSALQQVGELRYWLPGSPRRDAPFLAAIGLVALLARRALGSWPRVALLGLALGVGTTAASRALKPSPRATAPDDWPPTGTATLALGTGDGVWRLDPASGRAYQVNAPAEPVLSLEVAVGDDPAAEHVPVGDAQVPPGETTAPLLRATTPLARRETSDWRTWRLAWPPDRLGWHRPTIDPPTARLLATTGLPPRGRRITALLPDDAGGVYLAVSPRRALFGLGLLLRRATPALRLRETTFLPQVPDVRELPELLLARLLGRRRARLYHVGADGERRLIAGRLPPVFALARVPTEGKLSGAPAPIRIRPIPTGPDPMLAGDAAASA